MHPVLCQIQNGVAHITMNRPKIHNAFDDELIGALTEQLKALNDDRSVRAVVLCGAGKSFSAGADLGWMKRMAQASEKENRKDARQLAKLMRTLNALGKPTIARVQGAAMGGGVGLVACCDIAVASDGARFALSETRLGLVPAVISPYVVDAIGARQAHRYFLTAETFDAATARALGLVHEVVAENQLDATIDALISKLLECGPRAVHEAKRLVQRIAHPDAKARRELDELNADLIAELRVGKEGKEGLSAFFDKRPPAWKPS